MKFACSLFLVLALTWFGLSGETGGLLLSLGVFSCALVTYMVVRMNYLDGDWHPLEINWLRLPGYALWLCREIVVSNLQVATAILLNPQSIKPQRFTVDAKSLSELGQVIYANSITLTPGTVSLFLRDGKIEVHGLLESAIEGLETGSMQRKVERLCTDTDAVQQPASSIDNS